MIRELCLPWRIHLQQCGSEEFDSKYKNSIFWLAERGNPLATIRVLYVILLKSMRNQAPGVDNTFLSIFLCAGPFLPGLVCETRSRRKTMLSSNMRNSSDRKLRFPRILLTNRGGCLSFAKFYQLYFSVSTLFLFNQRQSFLVLPTWHCFSRCSAWSLDSLACAGCSTSFPGYVARPIGSLHVSVLADPYRLILSTTAAVTQSFDGVNSIAASIARFRVVGEGNMPLWMIRPIITICAFRTVCCRLKRLFPSTLVVKCDQL